ncbi:MAG TPA: AAA family ATPase [Actinomycetota bacterium]
MTARLDVASNPLCSLAVQVRRITGSVVGRVAEIDAIEQELAAAGSRLSAVTLEGEPGIGKTRLLLAAAEIAEVRGYTSIAITADEEIRGPFLVARSILASPPALEAAAKTGADGALERAIAAISGRDEPGFEAMAPDQKLLRTFDLAAVAVAAMTNEQPLAVLVDDIQWADDDSLRLFRYVIRSVPDRPVFLLLATRPDEVATVSEAVNLVADMERMGLVRRIRLHRLAQPETSELLQQALGGTVKPSSAATVHAQAEGVPFIVEEVARAYRDAGMLQQIDGVWALAKNAERLVPSSVRTLIQRRGARLPDETKATMGDAAVLGRTFSLRDLAAVRGDLGDATDVAALAEALVPAVATGLLVEAPPDAPSDYSFSHDQVRELALTSIPAARRTAIHAALVTMLEGDGEPTPESLPLLAHHAAAAGDAARASRFSIAAAKAAIDARAPEEVLRVVDLALPAASTPSDRVALLTARDEALEMLRRSSDRLEGLAELTALAEALGDSHLELDVTLRRAAALRLEGDDDRAAELARRVRERAAEAGDRSAELAACLELGQALLRSTLGEGFAQSWTDTDFDGAEEAYARAEEVARELGADASVAAANRELGLISFSRARKWFVQGIAAGEMYPIMMRTAGGETPEQILHDLPIAGDMAAAEARFRAALGLYEKLGDRRGVMSSIIGLAYLSFVPDIHFGQGAARRIEEIRRLATQLDSLSRESEREAAEAQMLYGVHVFARAKIVPDLAISRGEEAYERARLIADHGLQFSAAGGTALAHLDLGDVEAAERWLSAAAAVAADHPTPLRLRKLKLWRGWVRAVAGDAAGMREHLGAAVALAADQGSPAGRAECLARLALESARLGREKGDEELLELALQAAEDTRVAVAVLPGRPPWGAQADAAAATVALARGDAGAAIEAARAALGWMMSAFRDDIFPEIFIPVVEAVAAEGTDEEREMTQMFVRATLAMVAQRTLDEEIRVRWFRGPVGRALSGLPGAMDGEAGHAASSSDVGDGDSRLLRLLTEGLTNAGIAERLEISEPDLLVRLGELYGRIGASSRADATAFAFRERVV